MSDLDIVKIALEAAHDAWLEVVNRREADRRAERDRHSAAMAAIDEKHQPNMTTAKKAEQAAQAAYDAAVAETAVAANASMFRGILVEWAPPKYGWDRPWQPTGRTGRWEICTYASKFAANMASYRLPKMGGKFIRPLKKDGIPSLGAVATLYDQSRWLPEGERHPNAEPLTEEATR